MGRSTTIVQEIRNRLGALITQLRTTDRAPAAGEPVADGGTTNVSTTVPQRRASAWAGVYAATFGVEEGEVGVEKRESENIES